MVKVILALLLGVEVVAFLNQGGGPLVSHLALTGATFAAVGVAILYRMRKSHAQPILEATTGAGQPAIIIIYLILCLSIALSFFASQTPTYGLSELLLFLNSGILLVLLASLKVEERDLTFFARGVITIVTVEMLVGFFFYTQTPIARLAGTFMNFSQPQFAAVNTLANVLLLVVPMTWWQLARRELSRGGVAREIFCGSVILTGLILTFSRGAWLSLLAAIILLGAWALYVGWTRRRASPRDADTERYAPPRLLLRRFVMLLITTALLTVGVQQARSLLYNPTSIKDKLLLQADEGGASVRERLDYWSAAAALIAERPLLGSGVRSFYYLYPPHQYKFGIREDHPHNIVLKIGLEHGGFALLAFVTLLVLVPIRELQFYAKYPWHPILFVMFGAFAALAHNMLDFNFVASNYTLFIIAIGLFCAVSRTAITANKVASTLRVPLVPLALLSLCVLGLALHEAWYNIPFKRGRAALASKSYAQAATLLEDASKLYFERDRAILLARAYAGMFASTQLPEWITKEHDILTEAFINSPHDAEIAAMLGENYYNTGDVLAAARYFEKAIALDPTNSIRYYYLLARSKETLGVLKEDTVFIAHINVLLNEYIDILARNEHFTILSENPRYVLALLRLLKDTQRESIFNRVWADELQKYTLRFGPVPSAITASVI